MSHVWQRLFAMNADYNIVNPFFCAAFVDKAWNERSCMAGGYTVLTTQTQSVCRESFRLCAWPNEKWCMSCSTKLCSFRFIFFLFDVVYCYWTFQLIIRSDLCLDWHWLCFANRRCDAETTATAVFDTSQFTAHHGVNDVTLNYSEYNGVRVYK